MKRFVTPACCPCFCWRCFFGGEKREIWLSLEGIGRFGGGLPRVACSCTPARLEHWWTSNWESWRQGARGGWRQEAPGGWRLEARGSWRLHRARSDFSPLDTGERARPLAWNLWEVTQWTKIQPPAAASSPPAAAAGRAALPGETGTQRRQQHPAATQGGSSLGEVWVWVSHHLAGCRVVAGQGGNAHRVAACRGCHRACCSPCTAFLD